MSYSSHIQYQALHTDMQNMIFVEYFEDWDFVGEVGYEPHRHDYHEILWVQAGTAQHTVDQKTIAIPAQTLALVARGQVHFFEETRQLKGYVVAFHEAFLESGGPRQVIGPLFHYRGDLDVLPLPAHENTDFTSLFALLHAEYERNPRPDKHDFLRPLLHALLVRVLWLHQATQREHAQPLPADDARYQTFMAVLETHFTRKHDVLFYAEQLHVSPSDLSRLLQRMMGRTTKQVISERLMLEAQRLLQFTRLSIKEIAAQLGFADAFHFSKAFKRHIGLAPQAWRVQWYTSVSLPAKNDML